MHRSSSKMLLILLTLAVFFSTFAATPNDEKKTLTLIEVRYVPGAGIVLLFNSTGLTSKEIQGGSAHVHSIDYDMSCGFKDDSQVVRCTIPTKLSQYAGETFRAHLAGFLFYPKLPAAKTDPLVCTDEETIWYTVGIYYNGNLAGVQEMEVEVYEIWQEIIATDPDFAGFSMRILDRYCGPQPI